MARQEKFAMDGYFTEDLKILMHKQFALDFKTNYSRWQKFVKAANLEKQWINERLRWFFTPQAVLFAFFGLTYSNNIPQNDMIFQLRYIISSLGILTSVCVFLAVLSAARMHSLWHTELSAIFNKYRSTIFRDEFTFGRPPSWPAICSRVAPLVLIFFFFIAWVIIFIVLLSDDSQPLRPMYGTWNYSVAI